MSPFLLLLLLFLFQEKNEVRMKNAIYFIGLFFLINSRLSASCGSATCPLHFNNPYGMGLFSLKLSHEYIYQDQIYAGSNRSFVGAIPGHHDEVSTLNQVTALSLGYGIFDFLGIDLYVPFVHRKHTHIHNHHGEQIPEKWNFSGLGDMTVLAHFSIFNPAGSSGIGLSAGIKLPTGVTGAVNDQTEPAEVTIQPGTGSTDFLFGAQYSRDLFILPNMAQGYSTIPINFSINYKLNTKGTDDFMFGNELMLHVSTAYRFLETAAFLLQVNGRFLEQADAGNTNEPIENTGGKWLFVSPGLKFYFNENLSLYGYFQIPVYQNVNGIQQAAAYNLLVGIQQELNLLD